MPKATLALTKRAFARLFNLVVPDDCRICAEPLRNLSRIPVCPTCLLQPKPLQADFYCRSCLTPFVDAYPLDENDLCTACREGLPNFDALYSFGTYEGTLRRLIHLFKYAKVETMAGPLSGLLRQALPSGLRFDMVMPMPMHWRKTWERGFNQAELLARPLADHFGWRMAGNLRRTRLTKTQAGLSEAERRENLRGSLAVRKAEQIRGRRILLVDDVFTTGATMRAAASTLRRAGAEHISGIVLARVDRAAPAFFRDQAGGMAV